MDDKIVRIRSYKIDSITSIKHLLSFFCVEKSSNIDIDILPYVRHCAIKQICQQIGSFDNEHQVVQLNSLIKELNINKCEYFWHCPASYHELWNSTIFFLLNKNSIGQLKSSLKDTILTSLLSNGSKFQESFIESENNCSDHCNCNTVKCLTNLYEITNDVYKFKLLDLKLLIPKYLSIIEDNSSNVSNRCFTLNFLQLYNILTRFDGANNILHNFIPNLINCIKPYLKIAHCFIGPRTKLDESTISDYGIEYKLDCPLIRCYILLLLKLNNCDSINWFMKQIKLLIEHDLNKKNVNDEEYALQWLISVLMTEDSQLFEALYLFSKTISSRIEEIHLLHRLFFNFLVQINHDPSTLLEMLTTDGSTATNLLRFLLVYLKLPFDHTSQNDNDICVQSICNTFADLKRRIIRLDRAGLYPYNPAPLIRLLNNEKFTCNTKLD